MNKRDLNNVLVRYLQLCETFLDSDIWSDEVKKSIDYFHTYHVDDKCPILDVIKPLDKARGILNDIKDGKCLISSKYMEVYDIADQLWYFLGEKSYIRDNTSDKEVVVDNDVFSTLSEYYNLTNAKCDKYFLIDVSGCVWEGLGGDI